MMYRSKYPEKDEFIFVKVEKHEPDETLEPLPTDFESTDWPTGIACRESAVWVPARIGPVVTVGHSRAPHGIGRLRP